MASWKTVAYLSFVIFGVIAFINESEAERRRKTKLSFNPPRIRDYFDIRNQLIERPGHKRKKLRSEILAAGNKININVPNPPVVLHHVLEHWPYNRVYVTSLLGVVRYIKKFLWIGYKIVWIFIDMFILLIKIVFQVTEIGKLKYSYDELNNAHTHAKHPHKVEHDGHGQYAHVYHLDKDY